MNPSDWPPAVQHVPTQVQPCPAWRCRVRGFPGVVVAFSCASSGARRLARAATGGQHPYSKWQAEPAPALNGLAPGGTVWRSPGDAPAAWREAVAWLWRKT